MYFYNLLAMEFKQKREGVFFKSITSETAIPENLIKNYKK